MSFDLQALLEKYIDQLNRTGKAPDLVELCSGNPQALEPLAALVSKFHKLQPLLSSPVLESEDSGVPQLPEGLVYVEDLGRGAFGRVVKARDTRLNRLVAVKLLQNLSASQGHKILEEARVLAALAHHAVPSVYSVSTELKAITTEYIEGFHLERLAPTLEVGQLVRIAITLARTLERTHERGLVHGDIKPQNIMIDAELNPRLLDFGLAQHLGKPHHGFGTAAYAAPELFRQEARVTALTDIYALGAVLFHSFCGCPPFEAGPTQTEDRSENHLPPMPCALRSDLPTAIQAIILKCMEPDPNHRYITARALVADLNRFLNGEEVLARPSCFDIDLKGRLEGHISDIKGWRRSGLIFDFEEYRLLEAYHRLLKPQDDWIPELRKLSWDQILLYLGVSVLFFGAMLLFYAYHFLEVQQTSLLPPLILSGTSLYLFMPTGFKHRPKAVTIAYDLAGLLVLPLAILTLLRTFHLLTFQQAESLRLFPSGIFTNAQVQLSCFLVFLLAGYRAWKTRTLALSSMAVLWALLCHLSLMLNHGWLHNLLEGNYHLVALDLLPFWLILTLHSLIQERKQQDWLARPGLYSATVLMVIIAELLTLNGKLMNFLGLSSQLPPEADAEFNPLFFDTVLGMVLVGMLVFFVARLLSGHKSHLLQKQGSFLYFGTPFLFLEPLAMLVGKDLYGVLYHWFYLGSALLVLVASGLLQRKSFYYAGLINALLALHFITNHYQWNRSFSWPFLLLFCGAIFLFVGTRLSPGVRADREK